MAEIVRVYHGSRGGLQGAIRPVSDCSADFGSGFFDGPMTMMELDLCDVQGNLFQFAAENGYEEETSLAKGGEPVDQANQGGCVRTMDVFRRVVAISVLSLAAIVNAATGPWDADVADFPRQTGETGDSARILRAVEAAGKGGVVWFPKGEYEIDAMLVVSNRCSLWLHKSAHLKAVKEMPFVMRYFGRMMEKGALRDYNMFIRGGEFDGNGLAGCANVMGLAHFTLADTTFRNGRGVGLQLGDPSLPRSIEGGYEIIANNLYFICNLPGLAGNVGFLTNIGDSHFTDMVVVDYTVGIRDQKWSNRYTRCHVWGGPVKKVGTNEPEYLPNSIAFDLNGYDCLLDDCYADTAMIGYRVRKDARIFNCAYFNNWVFKMDNPEVLVHEGGSLIVSGGRFSKNSPHATLYRRGENAGRLIWRDNQPLNFTEGEMKDLNEELKKQGGSDKSSVNDAKLAG